MFNQFPCCCCSWGIFAIVTKRAIVFLFILIHTVQTFTHRNRCAHRSNKDQREIKKNGPLAQISVHWNEHEGRIQNSHICLHFLLLLFYLFCIACTVFPRNDNRRKPPHVACYLNIKKYEIKLNKIMHIESILHVQTKRYNANEENVSSLLFIANGNNKQRNSNFGGKKNDITISIILFMGCDSQ